MRRRGSRSWQVCFADTTDLDQFVALFCKLLERDPATGGYGRWLNLLGRWYWWNLDGYFDGHIIGEPDRSIGRDVARCRHDPVQTRERPQGCSRLIGRPMGSMPCNLEIVS